MKNKLSGTNSMIEVLDYHNSQKDKEGIPVISLMNRSSYFSDFKDLRNNITQKLIVKGENEHKVYSYNEDDQFYVKYFEEKILVFIIKS